jgi:glycogen debranching enzyme
MTTYRDDEREWLEPDGLGGFAMGTVSGVRTRRYHGLLLTATTPPTGRMMLVNGFDAWVETASGRYAISSQRYAGGEIAQAGVVHPDGALRIESFTTEPWPTWTFRLEDGTRLTQEIVVPHGEPAAIVTWRLIDGPADAKARLIVRPLLSGRDYHSTHHENGALRAEAAQVGASRAGSGESIIEWRPYDGVPAIVSRANGRYEHAPDWYRRFLYTAERARGLDDIEDLWSPGYLIWDLPAADAGGKDLDSSDTEAIWHLRTGSTGGSDMSEIETEGLQRASALREAERTRRNALAERGPLQRAADAYLVRRGSGRTIVAGYPWFTDWGRDTFIALRGLCLSTGRLDDARDILAEWSGAVSEGMLPNRFVDAGDNAEFLATGSSTASPSRFARADFAGAVEYNAVDASLWFVIAVHDYFDRAARTGAGATGGADDNARERMMTAVQQILEGYARGTRYGIRLDEDGLLACGVPGTQLTWMDARVGDHVITPRIGKPVEVQALWLNALRIGAANDPRWTTVYEQGRASFVSRFWNDADACLFDVVDVDHRRGEVDALCRPNQIFAIGGLPYPLLDGDRARLVVDTVERRLSTPLGLRSLAPGAAGYTAFYGGGPAERDAAYHQGVVWPWLIGAFVDAWLRVRDESPQAIAEARERFLAPLMDHLDRAGLGHVGEIASAEPPFTPDGCPFQAWSLGELLRVREMLAGR